MTMTMTDLIPNDYSSLIAVIIGWFHGLLVAFILQSLLDES